MRRAPAIVLLISALLLSAATALPAAAQGAWTTYLRARQYSDVIARHDTVWCASPEGGLQRFLRAPGRFEDIARQPDGLASQALSALEFDRTGRLWIGTLDQGVSRLSADGKRWDLVSQLDGLPRGAVNALRAVGDTVLIGTAKGVALWNGIEIAGTVPDGVNPSPLASDDVRGLVLRGDSLWVGTGKGLYVSRASTGLASWSVADSRFANSPILGMAWDGQTLMAVVDATPFVLDPASGTWLIRGSIGAVMHLSDHGGVILASTERGIYRWGSGGWTSIPGGPVSTGCVPAGDRTCRGPAVAATDDAGRVWVANRDGLREEDSGDWTLHEHEAVVGNDIQNLALQGDRVYVATNAEGVGRFDGTHWKNWYSGQCPSGCDTTFLDAVFAFDLLVDRQGQKWVTNWDHSVESFDDDVSPPKFTHRPPTAFPQPDQNKHTYGWSSAADSAGGRWLGMDTNSDALPIGIEYYDATGAYRANYRPQNTPAMPSSYVRALWADTLRGHLWVGYRARGVTVFDLPGEPGGPLQLAAGGEMSPIVSLDVFGVAVHKDSAWVLSTTDLRRFSARPPFAQIGSALPITGSPAPRGACHPLDVGPDGTVWVGTDGGVHAYHPGGRIVEYTAANSPLAGDEVRAIRVHPVSGVVWIGTAAGLSRFDPAYVPPTPPPLASLEVSVFPNPALLTGAGLTLRLAGNTTAYRGVIFDASGRRVRHFEGLNGQVFWDGRDASGGLVRPGIYFIRVEAGGLARTVRVALLR